MRRRRIEHMALYHIKWERGFFGRVDNDVTQEFIMLGSKYPGFYLVATNNLSRLSNDVDMWWDMSPSNQHNYTWEVIESFEKIDRSELPLFLHWHRGKLFDQLLKGEL